MKPRWISTNLSSLIHQKHYSFTSFTRKFSTTPLFSTHLHIIHFLTKCGKQRNLQLGSSLHSSIIKTHYLYDPYNYNYPPRTVIAVWNSLISTYAKCGVLRDARKVFDEMPVRDIVSWNSIISGFLRNGDFEVGFEFFKEIFELGIGNIDQASFTTVLSACDGFGFLRVSKMIYGGFEGELTVGNSLITAYFKCGCSSSGERPFQEMSVRNVVTWTAVISGLVQNGLCQGSLNVFSEMRGGLVEPNSLTYSSVISACAGLQLFKGNKFMG